MIKNEKLRKAVRGLAIVLLVIAVGFFIQDAISLYNFNKSEDDLADLIEEVTEEVIDTTVIDPDDFPVDEIVKGSAEFHNKLLDTNSDYVGWISLPGLSLDYPLVYGDDNSYYLTRSFYKQYSSYGTIFLDYRNAPDFSQPQTVLYGHHMRNDTMFARLDELRKKANYAANSTFQIFTPDGLKTYRIFSVYPVDATTTSLNLPASASDLKSRISAYTKKSLYATGVDTSEATHIITLVTCTWVIENGRLFVHAIEVPNP